MLKNVETANSENNYKIILSEAANSQKRALLKTIVGIIVGIVIKQKHQTHINQDIQTILYFLPFRPYIKKTCHIYMAGLFLYIFQRFSGKSGSVLINPWYQCLRLKIGKL